MSPKSKICSNCPPWSLFRVLFPHLLSLFVYPCHIPSCHQVHIYRSFIWNYLPGFWSQKGRCDDIKLTQRLVIVQVRRASIFPTCAIIANNVLLLSPKSSLYFLVVWLRWHMLVSRTREADLYAASKASTGDWALQREDCPHCIRWKDGSS